jgi:hypothetical protein
MHECCEVQENRECEQNTSTLRVERCRVCQRRHYLLRVDPIQVGVDGGQL